MALAAPSWAPGMQGRGVARRVGTMTIEIQGIERAFGDFAALRGVDLSIAEDAELRGAARRRARARRPCCASSPALSSLRPRRAPGRWHRPGDRAGAGPPHRLRVPTLRPVPPHDRSREHRLRAEGASARRTLRPRPRSTVAQPSFWSACSYPASGAATPPSSRRPAPARSPGPSPGDRAAYPAARRAVRRTGCQSTSRNAGFTRNLQKTLKINTVFVTPRPGSARDRRPGRGDEPGLDRAGGHATGGL